MRERKTEERERQTDVDRRKTREKEREERQERERQNDICSRLFYMTFFYLSKMIKICFVCK